VLLHVGLEEPVFRRPLDLQPGCRQAVRSNLNICFGDDKINIVAGFWSAVDPQGIAASKRKRYSVGL